MKKTLRLLFLAFAITASPLLRAQQPSKPNQQASADTGPSFEVATIKPTDPNVHPQSSGGNPEHRFEMQGTTLRYLLAFSYNLNENQIVGAPAWVDSEPFDISAQSPGDIQANLQQLKAMLRKLLAERFALTTHNDKRELPVYILTVARGGPKLTQNDAEPNGMPSLRFRKLGMSTVHNASMAEFASLLQDGILDRPVLDQTGLPGKYDFTLNWTPDDSQFTQVGAHVPPPTDEANAPPGLFTAIQEQIGLKLEAKRAPATVLVVDRVEKPSPN